MFESRSYWRAITQNLLGPENKQDLGPKVPNYPANELEDDREFIKSYGLDWLERLRKLENN